MSLKSSIKSFPVGTPLNYLTFNREVNPSHVTSITESLEVYGLLRPIVMVKTNILSSDGVERLYIADGQHTANALERLKMPIEYVEVKVKTQLEIVKLVAKLNSTGKPWQVYDYVNTWAYLNEDYRKLMKYYNNYDFDFTTLADILMRKVGAKSNSRVLKGGEFKIVDEKYAVVLFDYITDLLRVVPRMGRWDNRVFINAYVAVYNAYGKTYNHSKFMKHLKEKQEQFVLATQSSDAMQTLLISCI